MHAHAQLESIPRSMGGFKMAPGSELSIVFVIRTSTHSGFKSRDLTFHTWQNWASGSGNNALYNVDQSDINFNWQ